MCDKQADLDLNLYPSLSHIESHFFSDLPLIVFELKLSKSIVLTVLKCV